MTITKLTPFSLAVDLTTDEDIRKARIALKFGGNPILSEFFERFTQDPDGNDRNLVNLYAIADEQERGTMDALMIALCGYPLSALVEDVLKRI